VNLDTPTLKPARDVSSQGNREFSYWSVETGTPLNGRWKHHIRFGGQGVNRTLDTKIFSFKLRSPPTSIRH